MQQVRIPLLAAFLLAVLLSLVNVSAYKQASVSSGMTVTVDTTQSAAVALSGPGPMVSVSGGVMSIDFRQGNGGVVRELQSTVGVVQSDSVQMRDVFRIANTSTRCQNVSVYVVGANATNLTAIYGRLITLGVRGAIPGDSLAGSQGLQQAGRTNLGASGSGKNSMAVDVWWDAGTAAAAGNFTIRVESTYTATCP